MLHFSDVCAAGAQEVVPIDSLIELIAKEQEVVLAHAIATLPADDQDVVRRYLNDEVESERLEAAIAKLRKLVQPSPS